MNDDNGVCRWESRSAMLFYTWHPEFHLYRTFSLQFCPVSVIARPPPPPHTIPTDTCSLFVNGNVSPLFIILIYIAYICHWSSIKYITGAIRVYHRNFSCLLMHLHNSWIKCKWFAFKGYYHVRWQRSTRHFFVIHIRAQWFALYTYARTQCEIINTHTHTQRLHLLNHHHLYSQKSTYFLSLFFLLYSFGTVLKPSSWPQNVRHKFCYFVSIEMCAFARCWLTHLILLLVSV